MDPALANGWLWNADPVLFRVGGVAVRTYSALYFLAFAAGYALWHQQMRRAGHGAVPTSRFLLWMFLAVVLGGRIGEWLLFNPGLPLLDLRRGGMSSHGATAAIFAAAILYARRYGYSVLEVGDRMALSVLLGAALVRVGNFFNSELVGREWGGAWAVRFARFAERSQAEWESLHGPLGFVAQPLPRHPVQLYEAAAIGLLFTGLWLLDRRLGERRPRGLFAGLFCGGYFVVRGLSEQFKEYLRFATQVPDPAQEVIRMVPTAPVTMAQLASLPFALVGLGLVIFALRRRLPASQLSKFDRTR